MTLDTTDFRQKLETEKASLEAELSRVGRQDPEHKGNWEVKPDNEPGSEFRDEVADHLEEMDEREATEQTLEHRLREVMHALERLAAGTYGICEVGQESIELDRLEANPAARTCKAHLAAGDHLPL